MTLRQASILSNILYTIARIRQQAHTIPANPQAAGVHIRTIQQELIPDLLVLLDSFEPTTPSDLAPTGSGCTASTPSVGCPSHA